jgi:hypothetical protein
MKKIYLIALFTLAFLERTAIDLGPNIELVTMAMVLSAYYFGKKESFWLTFAVIVATDRLIGNSNIFFFTWSGFLIPALLASGLLKRLKILITNHSSQFTKKIFTTMSLATVGITANIFFFLWTNFGVWFLDSWNMYPNTFQGLITSYINGLPFLRYQLASTIIFIPLVYGATELSLFVYSKLHLSNNSEITKIFY